MTDCRAPYLFTPLLAPEKGLPAVAGEGWGGALLILALAKSQSTPSQPPPAYRERSKASAELKS
jgi:hypothetical protein